MNNMKTKHQYIAARIFGVLCLLGLPYVASAGVVVAEITYSPDIVSGGGTGGVPSTEVQGVPTLSEWGLVAMALLVAVMAYRALRSSLPRHPLAVVFLAGALGISMFGNTELMLKAMAATVDSFLSEPEGYELRLGNELGERRLINTSGVPQQIKKMESRNSYLIIGSEQSPQCTVGRVLQNNDACYLKIVFSGLPG